MIKCYSSLQKGTVYSLNVYDFPEGGRQAKGLPIVNVLPIDQDEKNYGCCTGKFILKRLEPHIMLTKKAILNVLNWITSQISDATVLLRLVLMKVTAYAG